MSDFLHNNNPNLLQKAAQLLANIAYQQAMDLATIVNSDNTQIYPIKLKYAC
jgi:chromosome segregation and condensation protein ScpB